MARRYVVAIAVNGTVHIEVDAEDADAAEEAAAAQFFDNFASYAAQVGPKACYVEDVEEADPGVPEGSSR